jgi:hypothetical protein
MLVLPPEFDDQNLVQSTPFPIEMQPSVYSHFPPNPPFNNWLPVVQQSHPSLHYIKPISIGFESPPPVVATPSTSQPQYQSQPGLPPTGLIIPSLPPKTPKSEAWRVVVEHWQHGLPQNDIRPLQDWPKEWRKGTLGQLWKQRETIALEFLDRCVKHPSGYFNKTHF